METKTIALLVGAAAFAGPVITHASSITYDVTGTVTSATGTYSDLADGTAVTGTYTINLANGVGSFSTLPISSTKQWKVAEASGTYEGLPSNSAYVFSASLNAGAYSYATPAIPDAYYSTTNVVGQPDSFGSQSSWSGDDIEQSNSTTGVATALELTQINSVPWSSNGLPVLSGTTSGTGFIESFNNGTTNFINFNVTSLTPVPLPAAACLLVSGLGGIGVFARKRRAA